MHRPRPLAGAISPGGAMRLAMARAGVAMPSAVELDMPTGELLDMRWLGPALVSEVVGRAAGRAEDAVALAPWRSQRW
eukprot:2464117-Pyramimonas_sp.AAC.1